MVSDAGIRFVMEGPHATRVRQKKRARLVTACDACRIKKVKCFQSNPTAPCEACKTTNTTCVFGDRDKYHAERGTSATNGSPKSTSESPLTPSGSDSRPTSSRNSPANQSWMSNDSKEQPNPNCKSPVQPFSQFDNPHRMESRSRSTSFSTECSSVPASVPSSPPESSRSIAPFVRNTNGVTTYAPSIDSRSLNNPTDPSYLFDPQRPRYPRPELMEHLTDLFFEHLSCHLPFLHRSTTVSGVRAGTLPVILANGIAALSCRFSNRRELLRNEPRYAAGEPFLHMAKLLVVPMMSWPSIEVLHALILIAWAEYGSARDSGLFMYARMATSMLLDLGLGSIQAIELAPTEAQKDVIRFTRWSVASIDLTSSWVTGRPASLKDSIFDNPLPPMPTGTQGFPAQGSLFAYLTDLFAIRDQVTNMMNDEYSRAGGKSVEVTVASIQGRLKNFYASLPSTLIMNAENYKHFNDYKQGSVLLLLHLMFHGANALVHWPSLFKEFIRPVPYNREVSYASARSLVEAILIAYSVDPGSVMTNAFFDVPVSVAARTFIASRGDANAVNTRNSLFNPNWNESNLNTCMNMLKDMSRYWGGAAIVRLLLEQLGSKSSGAIDSRGSSDPKFSPRPNALSQSRRSSTTSVKSAADDSSSIVSSVQSPGILTPMFEDLGRAPLPLPLPSLDPNSFANSDEIFASFFQSSLIGDDFSDELTAPPSTQYGLKSTANVASHANGASSHMGLLTPRLESSYSNPPSW